MKTSVYTMYETIILNSITLDAYDIETSSNFETIQECHKIFLSEYGFMIARVGERNAFKEWLQGLPSAATVPFYNNEILNIAYAHGKLNADASEKFEDKFLNDWFMNLSLAFFTLKENL